MPLAMLQAQDDALLLTLDRFGEQDAIVQCFTQAHGLMRGMVRRGFSRKQQATMQPATLAEAHWSARLPEHLPTLTLEARHSFAARVMHDPLRLAAIGSVTHLLARSLADHDPHPELYATTLHFFQHVTAGVEPLLWLGEYVRLELALLELAGFGLDLSTCAATGSTEALIYVSPKSGRAVCASAGAPYHERLLPLPVFLTDEQALPSSLAAILEGLRLTGYFLEERMLPALHRTMPPLRAHFVALLTRLS